MKKLRKFGFIAFLFIISFNFAYAREIVTFSKCVDGDTIKVLVDGEEKTVRFLAVDTPESVHPTKGVEFYGKEASDYTCTMITNAKKIELEYDENSDKEDKYDRLLAWVWVDDTLLQDELIKNGYAEVAYLYDDYKYTDILKDHQSIAEEAKIGIWNDEAREKFVAEETIDNDDNKIENEKKETINLNDMSTKEIIILIVVIVLLSIVSPIIKKSKRKIKKLLK